jgi:hypothetical protein
MAKQNSRKASRKANRKASRKNRKASRKTCRRMSGGRLVLAPMELTDSSMLSASRMSGAQGVDFFNKHAAQHGGMAPVGDSGMLDAALRGAARISPLDDSISASVAHGAQKAQAGGKRRKASRKAGRKGRKATRRGRKMYGGMRELGYMNADAPGMLLAGQQARAALSNMNNEWRLAEHAGSFAPK